jgi:mRNA interferase HigB
MHVIALSTLRDFWERHPGAEQPLRGWYAHACASRWAEPDDVKRDYASASIPPGSRAVFYIGGNTYRLVAAIHYGRGKVYVRFVGTHAEYDRTRAEEV